MPLAAVGKLIEDVVLSGIVAAGFAVLFNVPPRLLLACVFAGAAGRVVRDLVMGGGLNIEPATLAGAVVVGLMGEYFARRYTAPALIFTVSGAIPMVPGAFAYRAMLGLIRVSNASGDTGVTLLSEAAINLTKTGIILAAIAIGITMPVLLFRRRKPIV